MNKKKVFIVGFWPDYEVFFLRGITLENFEVHLINLLDIYAKGLVLPYTPRFIKNIFFRWNIKKIIKNSEVDVLIFQEHRLIFEYLLTHNIDTRVNVLLRNSVRSNPKTLGYISGLKKKGHFIWSFDQSDCYEYELYFYNQMIRENQRYSSTTTMVDFSFVGRNKGREPVLIGIKKQLEAQNYSMILNIRGSSKDSSISYESYLAELCRARCIVDIVQDKQSGLTLRPLEAMVYKRKVITNNIHIRNALFYHPNNIMILEDVNRLPSMDLFLESPFVDVSEIVENNYSADSVINKILSVL